MFCIVVSVLLAYPVLYVFSLLIMSCTASMPVLRALFHDN